MEMDVESSVVDKVSSCEEAKERAIKGSAERGSSVISCLPASRSLSSSFPRYATPHRTGQQRPKAGVAQRGRNVNRSR